MQAIEQSPVTILVPVMTKELFAQESGLRLGQVKGQAERKNLPMVKIGRLSLVNVAKMAADLQGVATITCPAMAGQLFADLSGLTHRQVETQLGEKNLPRREVGRLVLVDVAELYRQCLAQKPQLHSV
jgi:hypothetical protein